MELSRREVLITTAGLAAHTNATALMNLDHIYEIAIVGGSFAGLSAALQLGRAYRSVVVFDTGEPRNAPAKHSHGFLTNDGKPPKEILKAAKRELAKYQTIRLVPAKVEQISQSEYFELQTAKGTVKAKKVILAYGGKDLLPEIPGLRAEWGNRVFHCPYCHGFEFARAPLGILGAPGVTFQRAMHLRDWTDQLTVFLNGATDLDATQLKALKQVGAIVVEERVVAVASEGKLGLSIQLTGRQAVEIAGLLITTPINPSCDLHLQLGCETVPNMGGTMIKVDEFKKTTVKGVFAAGDAARPFNVPSSVADGTIAASVCHHELIQDMIGKH